MTSKRNSHRFYKGRGAPSMGHIAKGTDKYIVDVQKYAKNTFVVPSLKGFKLKPYIAPQTEKKKIPRPELIVKVNFNQKLKQERQIRIAKQIELESILTNHYKKARETGEKLNPWKHSKLVSQIKRLKHEISFFNAVKQGRRERTLAKVAEKKAEAEAKVAAAKAWEERKKVLAKLVEKRQRKIEEGKPVAPLKPGVFAALRKMNKEKKIAAKAAQVAEQQTVV
eukprot:UN02009